MRFLLSPSILAADFAVLGSQIEETVNNGADYLHIDVMDGDFVPSISFGMPVIKSIRKATGAFFDVHLMVRNPERYIEEFVKCGADSITVHVEATADVKAAIELIRKNGVKAGVSINPETPVERVYELAEMVDMILVMTVNPGFGGQKYIESSTEKIKKLRAYLDNNNLTTDIEVDGGITRDNIDVVLDAGANVIVMGSSVFNGNIKDNTLYFKRVLSERG